jgi:hypothetical protein
MASSRTVIGYYALNGQMCIKAHTALTAPYLQTPYEKNHYQWPNEE